MAILPCVLSRSRGTVPQHMAEEASTATVEIADQPAQAGDAAVVRIYEVGYHVMPTIQEENLEKIVSEIRSQIEKSGGSFIAEGAPAQTRLAYNISTIEAGKRVDHDRAYFGWIKFESTVEAAQALEQTLKANKSLLRHIIFETVREDTRAKMKAPQLREVKRTDIIKTAPRREEQAAAPVSEEQLEKALEDITQE